MSGKCAISGQELYRWYQSAKAAISSDISLDELDWLLQTVTSLDKLSIRLGNFPQAVASNKSLSELKQLWQQRLQERLPVQYLLETIFWRHFQLKVTPAVLIPRPETELIIDLARDNNLSTATEQHWVDLGTGSGAIALGLADVFPQATVHAVDLSTAALKIAKENAISLNLQDRIRFYRGSWWSPLDSYKGKIAGMVSNPPYIPTQQIAGLQPEVALHEPHLALNGGTDGLDGIRQLIQAAPTYLVSGGMWLIELMQGQAPTVAKLLEQQGEYYQIRVLCDLNGIERFVLAYRA